MLYLILGIAVGIISWAIVFKSIDWKKVDKKDIFYTMLIMEMGKK